MPVVEVTMEMCVRVAFYTNDTALDEAELEHLCPLNSKNVSGIEGRPPKMYTKLPAFFPFSRHIIARKGICKS
jgi:hypothetical protein